MLFPIKEYYCGDVPTDEDIRTAMVVSKTDSCMVKLTWSKIWPCDKSICVCHTMSFESCKKQILDLI